MKKVLVATEKPFAAVAVSGIREIVEGAGMSLVLLEKYTDKSQLLEAVADVDALIVRSDKVTSEVVAAAKNLKIVVRAGAGYDNVDLAACSERGIVVMNTPGQNSNAVAELAIGLMIMMARNCYKPGTGSEISGKRLGIHAYGNVGRLVGRYGKAMGMKVKAFDPFITDPAVFEADGVEAVQSIEQLYSSCDYVSVHIPATDATRRSIGYELLSKMPVGATIVNTARKEVIDEEVWLRFWPSAQTSNMRPILPPTARHNLLSSLVIVFLPPPRRWAPRPKRPISMQHLLLHDRLWAT